MRIKFYVMAWALGVIILFSGSAPGQEWKDITPTDVYYLAKSLDDSLISMYGLSSKLNKKRISNNLKPRNVYQKVLAVADEFSFLHANALNPVKLTEARNIDMNRTGPGDVYGILTLMKDYLAVNNAFAESAEARTQKTPNDVFQMLRQISLHHNEIARKKSIATDWATPKQVYETVVTNILPAVEKMAHEAEIEHKVFPFPKQPVSGVIPRYVYKLLYHVYKNISEFYMNKGGYDPIIIEEVNDCDDISPADVFDLAVIISAELKVRSGKKNLDTNTASQYKRWKESKDKIVPGDVFRLIQYNFILTRRVLEK